MVHNTTDSTAYPEILNNAEQRNRTAHSGISPDADDSSSQPSFDPGIVPQLPSMSVQQLNMLEGQINQEFTALAHEYLKARISRLNYIIEHLDSNIENSKASDSRWSSFYNSQVQAVNDLNHITENLISDGSQSSSKQVVASPHELETKINLLITSMESPLEYDELFNGDNKTLPFHEYFAEIIDHHKVQLSALSNLDGYHSRYMESITEKNKILTWKKCKLDIVEHKEELINKTREELRNLNNEFYSITSSISLARSDKSYYRSNVPVMNMKEPEPGSQLRLEVGNIDTFYDIDNVYYKKNQLEISDTKRAVQARDQQFKDSSNSHHIPQLESVMIKLDGCMGLSAEEAESDLLTLRAHSSSKPDSRTKSSTRSQDSQISTEQNTANQSSEPSSSKSDQEYKKLLDFNRMPSRIKFETRFH